MPRTSIDGSRYIRRATQASIAAPRRLMAALLGAAVTGAVVLVALVLPAGAQDRGDTDAPAVRPVELVPDLTLLLQGATVEDPAGLVASLEAVDGVIRASLELAPGVDPVAHLALAEGSGRSRPLDVVADRAIEVVEADVDGPVDVSVGGAAAVDRELNGRYGRSARALAVVGLAVGAALGLVFGLRRGAVTGLAIGSAVLAAGGVGDQVAGGFDGTMAATALPAALAGLVVAAGLAYRLLVWFRQPTGADGAARIQASVVHLAPELGLALAGLGLTALVVEPIDPGRSAVTVGAAGALVAAILTLALLAPALVVLERDRPGPQADRLPLSVTDGRDLPLSVVGLATLALTILSIVALGRVGGPLLGVAALDRDGPAATVAAAQARLGGDPTEGLVAAPSDSMAADFAGWAALVAERSEVAWVDLGASRLTAAGPVEVEPWALLSTPDAPGVAVIVPSVSPRSPEGHDLIDRLRTIPLAGGTPRFSGPAVDVDGVTGSRVTVIAAVVALAAVGGLATMALTRNGALMALSIGLRLIGGGATVGLHHLLGGDPTAASALTVLVAIAIGAMLSELELVRRLRAEHRSSDGFRWSPLPGNPGQYGAFGVIVAANGGLVLAVAGAAGPAGPGTLRLGLALVLAGAAEVLIGAAVHRPALLGQRSAYQVAARPVRVAIHGRSTGDPDGDSPPDDDPALRQVVCNLIETEFRLQTEPEAADLGLVFQADTPVHRQAAERQANLVGAGLRVTGDRPELRSLRTVRDHLPVIVTVTVDHPETRLVDQEGRVLGVRRPERRVGRLWLGPGRDGEPRVVESIELGATPLEAEDGAGATHNGDHPA